MLHRKCRRLFLCHNTCLHSAGSSSIAWMTFSSSSLERRVIKADYLISSHFSVDNFIFIIKANAQGELKCDFLCCSIFEKGDRDYETNQKARTLMKKERIHIPSNTTDILLDRLSAQTRPEDKTTDLSDNTEAKSDVSQ